MRPRLRATCVAVFEIGFVQYHQRGRSRALEQMLDRRRRRPGARGVIRIGDEYQPRIRRDRGRHCSHIVPERHVAVAAQRRHFDRRSAVSLVTSAYSAKPYCE